MKKNLKRIILLSVLFLTFISAAAFAEESAAAPQLPAISFQKDATSEWVFDIDMEEYAITFYHPAHPEYVFEIDCDNISDDKHYMGITPIINGVRMESGFFWNTAPFLYPVLDPTEHHIEKISIQSDNAQSDVETKGDYFKVRFEGGSYRLLRPVGGDEPLFMEAAFYFGEKGLYIFVNGLYYILPTMNNTSITFISRGEEITREVTPESEPILEYFDDVTDIQVNDGVFGKMDIMTYVNRIQFQVHQNSGTTGFELDLDHSFKDRGQKEILSKIFIEYAE
ncbi:MAG TPA: hypothetical protein PLO84_01740 [Thermotogota bacterium]|nr:hypothetical protein [Thermotogota bacterium]HPJ87821.1 hypothetical protein [Thermotogota bacterium]